MARMLHRSLTTQFLSMIVGWHSSQPSFNCDLVEDMAVVW